MSARIPQPNYTQMPNVLFDRVMDLPRGELVCLLYLVRHTFGYHEEGGIAISLDEFQHGRKRKDGSRRDRGTGLSESCVREALSGLEKRGLLARTRQAGENGGWLASHYELLVESTDAPPSATAEDFPLKAGNPLPPESGEPLPPKSEGPFPLYERKSTTNKAGRQRNAREAAESCNPPQPACLPADSALTAPTGDERQAALVAFGATADEARAILCDDAALPLSRLQGWIAEYGVRTARGNAIARPIAWLRTCLRSGEAAPAPPSAPAPAAEDPHGEWSMEKRIRMTAAIEQRDRREAEERTRAAHEAMQQMLARLDAARATRPVGAGDGALRP